MRSVIVFALFALVIAGCRRSSADQDTAQEHEHGTAGSSFTVFTDSCEFFIEIGPLVKNAPVEAAVHITRLSTYKPVSEGSVTLLLKGTTGNMMLGESTRPAVPGIFKISGKPAASGPYSLLVLYRGSSFSDSVSVGNVTVYSGEEESKLDLPAQPPADAVRFTKEMAWKIDFNVIELKPAEIRNTIRTSGTLDFNPSEIVALSAKSDGILIYRPSGLVPGMRVRKGESLFTLTGEGLTSKNMNTNLAGMKSRFENSKAAYSREKDLVRDQIVSQKQFKETVMRYQTDSIQYFSFLATLSLNKMDLVSPVDGFIRQVFQPNGSFVSEGTPLVSLGSTDMILLTADLPQRYWQEIPSITSASFRPSGSTIVYRIEDFGGRMVARGAQVTPDNQFIPVTFEFRNQASFVAGSFAEVFLHGSPVKDQLLIPVSSILEEQGNHYVYVQIAGEYYQKRYIRPGLSDGAYISVLTGLQAGERVVSRGAIFLKASSQTTGSASHGHEH